MITFTVDSVYCDAGTLVGFTEVEHLSTSSTAPYSPFVLVNSRLNILLTPPTQ